MIELILGVVVFLAGYTVVKSFTLLVIMVVLIGSFILMKITFLPLCRLLHMKDNSYELTRDEQRFVRNHYKQCLREMIAEGQFDLASELSRANKENDWLSQLDIMLEWYQVETWNIEEMQ